MDNFESMTDEQLAELACIFMYGPAPARTPDGAPMYPPALTGRIVRGVTLELAHEFHNWLIYREFFRGNPINYRQDVIYRQHESMRQYDEQGKPVHPVGQAVLYRSIYTREHVIADGAASFEYVDLDRARAETVATLKAASDGAK